MEEVSTSVRIKRLLEEFPGLHMREVARRLGIDVRAAKYHLDRLEKGGYLTAVYFSRHKRYYPRRDRFEGEVVDRHDKLLLAHLRNPVSLSLVVHLLSSGPSRLADISREADISPSRASFHLRKLEKAGIVQRNSSGGPRYSVRDEERVKQMLPYCRPSLSQADLLVDLWETLVERS